MPRTITPKQYLLTADDRNTLIRYLKGEIGMRAAGTEMNIDHQNVPRIANAIIRDAVINGALDITHVVKDY